MTTADAATMADNIIEFWQRATPAERAEGLAWYSAAREYAENVAHRTGVGVETVAAVIAALSPQAEWNHNLRWAADTVEAYVKGEPLPRRGLGNNLKRAARILSGDLDDIRRTRGTLKVHSFWNCILGVRDYVTIDRHAYRVALGDATVSPPSLTDNRYNTIADAYRIAAHRLGVGVRHVQAVTWMVVKRERKG